MSMATKYAAISLGALVGAAVMVSALAQTRVGDWVQQEVRTQGVSRTTLTPVRNLDGDPPERPQGAIAESAPFSSSEALDRISAAAAGKVAETIGTQNRADGSPPLEVGDGVIGLDDLTLVEFRRAANTKEILHAAGTRRHFGTEQTVWVATWKRQNVVNDRGTALTVTVELVMEDGTGKIVGATITSFDPSARLE
jgi:hypothetical protein